VTTIRVLLVDDDDLMRVGLRGILSSDEGIEVVGEASDGAAALEAANRLLPHVVLMDVRMPGLDGIAATERLLALSDDVRVVILTTFEEDDYVFAALAAGASGFLLKRARPEELIAAVHAVAAGDFLLAPSVTRTVVERLSAQPAPDPDAHARIEQLTPREREVLLALGRGQSNAEIAAGLFIEETTVRTHVRRILRKLRLRDRIHAVVFAYESGLIRAGDEPPAGGAALRHRE
jgi:DNA-binding NarL/FixJ family response regulator